jgi:phosphinothricin acetyltransferase
MTAAPIAVRPATPADARACAAIYAPYVVDTVSTFELEAPDEQEMAGRIAAASRTHAWLVATMTDWPPGKDDAASEVVVGYAYGGPYKQRAAYRWSCEVSVYVERDRRSTGAGRALYAALFERLAARGYRMAVAGMTLPNPASEGLHRAMGFTLIGVFRDIGWKSGAWHDVAWLQRPLADADPVVPPGDVH